LRQQARKQSKGAKEAHEEPAVDQVQKAVSEDPLSRIPYAKNRNEGKQAGSLTKDLFKQAREKVKEEKAKEKEREILVKQKKDREAQLQEDIKLRNQELHKAQKQRGQGGPSLKER